MNDDQNRPTVTLVMDGELKGTGPFGIDVTAGETELLFNGELIGRLDGFKFTNGEFTTEANLVVEDQLQYTVFFTTVLASETLDITLRGDITIDTTILFIPGSYSGSFDKQINMRGFDKFDESNVIGLSLDQSGEDEVKGQLAVEFNNPGPVAFDPVGDVNLGLFTQDLYLGYAFASNLTIEPGKFTAVFNLLIQPDSGDPQILNNLFSDNIAGKPVPIEIKALPLERGLPVSSIPLYRQGLQPLAFQTAIPGGSAPFVQGFDIERLRLLPIGTDNSVVASEWDTIVSIFNPFGDNSTLDVYRLDLADVALKTLDGSTIGTFSKTNIQTRTLPRVPGQPINTVRVELDFQTDIALAGAGITFSEFLIRVFDQPEEVFKLEVPRAKVYSTTALGPLDITLPINIEPVLKGADGFAGSEIFDFQLPRDDPSGGIECRFGMRLSNPSAVSTSLGDVFTYVGYKGVFQAAVGSRNIELKERSFSVVSFDGKFHPPFDRLDETSELLSNFLGLVNQTTTFVGIDPNLYARGRRRLLQQNVGGFLLGAALESFQPRSNQNVPDWLKAVVSRLRFDVQLNPVSVEDSRQFLQDFTVQNFDLDFTNPNIAPVADVSIVSSVLFPKQTGFDKTLQRIALNFNIFNDDPRLSDGRQNPDAQAIFGRQSQPVVFAGGLTVGFDRKANITVELPRGPINPSSTVEITKMAQKVISEELPVFYFKGLLDLSIQTKIGTINFNGVPLISPFRVQGLNSFSPQNPDIFKEFRVFNPQKSPYVTGQTGVRKNLTGSVVEVESRFQIPGNSRLLPISYTQRTNNTSPNSFVFGPVGFEIQGPGRIPVAYIYADNLESQRFSQNETYFQGYIFETQNLDGSRPRDSAFNRFMGNFIQSVPNQVTFDIVPSVTGHPLLKTQAPSPYLSLPFPGFQQSEGRRFIEQVTVIAEEQTGAAAFPILQPVDTRRQEHNSGGIEFFNPNANPMTILRFNIGLLDASNQVTGRFRFDVNADPANPVEPIRVAPSTVTLSRTFDIQGSQLVQTGGDAPDPLNILVRLEGSMTVSYGNNGEVVDIPLMQSLTLCSDTRSAAAVNE